MRKGSLACSTYESSKVQMCMRSHLSLPEPLAKGTQSPEQKDRFCSDLVNTIS